MAYKKIRMYLVNARMQLGYSQYRAAEKAQMSHQHYNRVENGQIGKNIQFRTILSICKALNIRTSDAWHYEESYQKTL